MTYYIYEIPGIKNGATKYWEQRSQYNFEHYGIMPVIIETIEGPDTPEMWQIVGDREWELADQNGYTRGTHYREAIEKRSRGAKTQLKNGTHNFQIMDKDTRIKNARATSPRFNSEYQSNVAKMQKGIPKPSSIALAKALNVEWKCEHCDKRGKQRGAYTRWHGDSCKQKLT